MHAIARRLKHLPAAIACAAIMLAIAPFQAQAYDMPHVHIAAEVRQNGDVRVTEARTFRFDDDVNGVYWSIPFADNQQGNVSSIDIDGVEVEGTADWLRGTSVDFSQASDASNGNAGVYTVEENYSGLELKVFMPQKEDDTATVTLTYTLRGAVMAWPDTAELYWQFIGSEWEESSRDVQLEVTFAGARAGTMAVTGTDDATLRAWGHGPLEGTVEVHSSEGSATVLLDAPRVAPGQFAEVRVAFPSDWVPDLKAEGTPRLETILEEERAWADEANARRERARVMATVGTVVLGVSSVALFAAVVVLRFTKYKSPKPVFEETYFRDLPSNDHPAVLSALLNDGTVGDCAFIATLMKLTDDRVVELVQEKHREKKFLRGEQEVTDYALRLLNKGGAHGRIDRVVLESYFGKDAKDGDLVRFDKAFSSELLDEGESPEQTFEVEVKARLEARNLTNQVPVALPVASVFASVVIFIAGVLFLIATDGVNLPLILVSILLALATIPLAFTVKKYTQEAVELRGRCVALKRWLEDFTRLNEAVPGDLILWNKMLVMAVAFGVSEDVVRELADAVPREMLVDDDGRYYYPSYYWYYSYGNLHSPMHELTDTYSSTIRELAMSSDSSGGGFGGGFSGGGGGGVGGGGGGTF